MYQYSDFDRQFVQQRAAQFRDQLERSVAGTLGGDEFKPLRLQNGWYIQRFAPMLRVAVPYGELNSAQLRVLAQIARDYDHKEDHDVSKANAALADVPSLPDRCGHFTTRQNVQYNWIPLARSADVMDLLASVNMHGIQTSGNCIRNITSDERAGIAVDEIADPRPIAEILRLVKGGVIAFTVDQQPYVQGFYPVLQLTQYLRYGLRPASVDAGATIITRLGMSGSVPTIFQPNIRRNVRPIQRVNRLGGTCGMLGIFLPPLIFFFCSSIYFFICLRCGFETLRLRIAP